MGHGSWSNNYPQDLSGLQLVAEWVPDSVRFLIDSYLLSMILGDLKGSIWCAPIIEVINMDYRFFSPMQSGDLKLFMRIYDHDLGVLR